MVHSVAKFTFSYDTFQNKLMACPLRSAPLISMKKLQLYYIQLGLIQNNQKNLQKGVIIRCVYFLGMGMFLGTSMHILIY